MRLFSGLALKFDILTDTYPGQLENNKMMNDDILNLHFEAEKLFEGCVRVFTELPKHLWHNEDIRIIQNSYYGGKSLRGAMQHHCFATDPDGLYSCHRINEEVAVSLMPMPMVMPSHFSALNSRSRQLCSSGEPRAQLESLNCAGLSDGLYVLLENLRQTKVDGQLQLCERTVRRFKVRWLLCTC